MSLTVVRISFLLLLLFFSFSRARVFIIIELFGMPHSLYIHTRKIYYLVFYDARDPEVLMWWWGRGWGEGITTARIKTFAARIVCALLHAFGGNEFRIYFHGYFLYVFLRHLPLHARAICR